MIIFVRLYPLVLRQRTQFRTRKLWWLVILIHEHRYLVIAAWALQLSCNVLHAAGPAYGYNLRNSTSHGWTLICAGSSCLYISMAFSKTAFSTTLLRLSSGGLVVVIWAVIAVTWAFAIALATIVWLQICEAHVDVGILAKCVPINTYMVSEKSSKMQARVGFG